jgi:hypothetical protein
MAEIMRVRTVFGAAPGSPYLSTMYFLQDNTQAGANAAVAAVGNFWNTIDASLVNLVTWATQPEVAVLNPAGTLIGLWNVTPATGMGNQTSGQSPPATQGLVRWNTGVFYQGRQIRGRTFIPAIPQAMATGGTPTGTLVTNCNAAASALIADANAEFGIYSRKAAGFYNVVTGGLWGQFAVLRSRRD